MRSLVLTLCLFAATFAMPIFAEETKASQTSTDTQSLATPETTVADSSGRPVITTRLIGSHTGARAGQTINLAWEFNLAPHWHIYWKNAGDSGLPPELTAESGSVGPFSFPTPRVIRIPPLTNYGYENTVTFTLPYTVPDNLEEGDHTLLFSGNFLYCNEVCLPGTVKLELPLTIAGKPEENTAYHADNNLPQPMPEGASASAESKTYTLYLPEELKNSADAHFIPSEDGLIDDSAEQKKANGTLTLVKDPESALKVESLNGILLAEGKGYTVELPFTAPPVNRPETEDTPSSISLPKVLALALLAGLILNLMPCVLPVLSLKVLSLVKYHHSAPDRARHALAYGMGVMVSFWIFAGVIATLTATGEELGWGFHLQNPVFVAILAGLMLSLALQFFGVYELGHSLTRLAALGQRSEKTWASFATGALAVLVATPCTVPFMGTAMAYALTQSLLPSLLVFTALGLGMAGPFLLAAAMPSLLKWLPKPGEWMETFRRLLGWPMLATALWLVYVFTNQTGVWAAFVLLTGLMLLSFTLWFYGMAPLFWKSLLIFGAIALSLFAVHLARQQPSVNWKPWSAEAVENARENQPVFVDFTADWCITCKVTELTVLNTSKVENLFKQHNVLYLRGDWTRQDPDITAELEQHGRKGVPLYLLYLPGNAEPQILPQVLTPGMLEQALASGTTPPAPAAE